MNCGKALGTSHRPDPWQFVQGRTMVCFGEDRMSGRRRSASLIFIAREPLKVRIIMIVGDFLEEL
ncbi:hypothetical protein CHX26_09350 [Porphyrobacter sp. HT-58-2]|nr:hypothetical protein CHX26_09350 [Porphyrobacter sp. HT-58-2]